MRNFFVIKLNFILSRDEHRNCVAYFSASKIDFSLPKIAKHRMNGIPLWFVASMRLTEVTFIKLDDNKNAVA